MVGPAPALPGGPWPPAGAAQAQGRVPRYLGNRPAGPKLAAHQAGKAICSEIWELTGGEGRSRGRPDGRRAGLRNAGRDVPRSSARKLVPDRGRPRALAGLTINRRKGPATAGRRRPPRPWLRPLLKAAGAGPRGCPGDTQCLCSE